MRIELKLIEELPKLRRVNGFGTTVAGRFDDPSIRPWYLKQFVVTLLFVPVFFGPIYAVQPGRDHTEWRFGASTSGSAFIRAYGWRAYWQFKGTVLLETIFFGVALMTILALLLFGVSWVLSLFKE
jgi:hypothetical protein